MNPVRKKIRALDSPATGRKFRALREATGIGLGPVAESMDISMTYLSELERGTRNWSEDLVKRFQEALKK